MSKESGIPELPLLSDHDPVRKPMRGTSFEACMDEIDAIGSFTPIAELANDARALYEPLLRARAAGSAFVIAQLGQSLDGCVATITGDSYFVTGPQSLDHLHRLRALSDVVLVGAGTVAIDNPKLTTRRVPGPHPVRAVLDPAARLDATHGVFTDGAAPTLWLCDLRHAAAASARLDLLCATAPSANTASTSVIGIAGLLRDGVYDPAKVIETLAARRLRRVFVEGGGATVSRFLVSGCLDRLHLIVAPVLIGAGKPGLSLPARQTMAHCPRLPASTLKLGDDLLWDLDLRAATPPIDACA